MILRPVKRWYQHLPVPAKIRLLIVATAAAALVVAVLLLGLLEVAGYRRQLASNIATLAQVTAVNATAATEFQDPSVAHTLVSSLSTEPTIDVARIFTTTGALLANHDARMDRGPNTTIGKSTLQSATQHHGPAFERIHDLASVRTVFHNGHLDAVAPVRLDNDTIGYVYVRANLARMYETLMLYAWTAASIMLAAIAIAYAVTLRMRESLTAPLVNLAATMKQVSAHQDYQARVAKLGNDEIGALVDGFNDMLAQVQERDRRLDEHRRYLEQQVAERTAHLEKALDDARLASKAKSEFLARMSHEIRTPMNGVLGMTELLRNSALDVRQRRLVDTVYKSGESLLQIINDILDFSKAEAGRLQLAHIDFSLRDAVEESCELLSERADAKRLELICAFDGAAPQWINGDPLRLKQVLINLIGNAIKFADRGNVVVRAARVANSSRLRFEVSDQGPGIDAADQERLFEPFTQADAVTTRAHGGTGLGLAIARELVTLMHGEIGVRSRSGHGSTFWFEIPYAPASEPNVVRMPRASLTGVHALVVDDNAVNREVLVQCLNAWGMTTATADDGDVALKMLSAAPRSYDVAILDHKMARMDGLTCVRNLRALPDLKDMRVILLSSLDLALRNPEIEALKISESLTKPVRHARLQAALMRVLGRDVSMQTMQMRALPQTRAPADALGNVRLLLVEDNDINREVALGMLESLGCEARVAINGAQAVELFAQERFDAVLMDCHMPVMDGYSATAAIRAQEVQRGRARTPILALTANALDGGRERCLAAGMDDFLMKPFTAAQLRELLERWAGKTLATAAPPAMPDSDVIEATVNVRAITAIQSLRSPDLLERIVALYESRTPGLIEAGDAALASGNSQALANAAHELKSSSANLGGDRLARICKECETLARTGGDAADAWRKTREEYWRFRISLQRLRLPGDAQQRTG